MTPERCDGVSQIRPSLDKYLRLGRGNEFRGHASFQRGGRRKGATEMLPHALREDCVDSLNNLSHALLPKVSHRGARVVRFDELHDSKAVAVVGERSEHCWKAFEPYFLHALVRADPGPDLRSRWREFNSPRGRLPGRSSVAIRRAPGVLPGSAT